MKRSLLILLFAAVLMFALAGCGGDSKEAPANADQEAAEPVKIADDRIIGAWEGEDGDVEFKENGTVVLDDGTELPFAMPKSDQLAIEFATGTKGYTVTWEGDDRHGVVSVEGTETTPTWYDRKK